MNDNAVGSLPLLVLRSVGSEHGSSVECNSLNQDVKLETGLYKDVETTVFGLPVARSASESPICSCPVTRH